MAKTVLGPLKKLHISPNAKGAPHPSARSPTSPVMQRPSSSRQSGTTVMSLTSPQRGVCHNCHANLGAVCFCCLHADCKPASPGKDSFTVCGACNVLHKNKPGPLDAFLCFFASLFHPSGILVVVSISPNAGSIHDATHKLTKRDNTFVNRSGADEGSAAAVMAASKKKEAAKIQSQRVQDNKRLSPPAGNSSSRRSGSRSNAIHNDVFVLGSILPFYLLRRPVTPPINGSTALMHAGVKCSKCGMKPIQGTRHHCAECNPSFDLCTTCHNKFGKQHGHHFSKITHNS